MLTPSTTVFNAPKSSSSSLKSIASMVQPGVSSFG